MGEAEILEYFRWVFKWVSGYKKYMNINDWLIKFKTSWENKNIEDVLSLFSSDVVYYETPFQKLNGHEEMRKEWSLIQNQNEINLIYNIFSKENDEYTVQWELKYFDEKNIQRHFAGIYLIRLNEIGQCIEFTHYCEESIG